MTNGVTSELEKERGIQSGLMTNISDKIRRYALN